MSTSTISSSVPEAPTPSADDDARSENAPETARREESPPVVSTAAIVAVGTIGAPEISGGGGSTDEPPRIGSVTRASIVILAVLAVVYTLYVARSLLFPIVSAVVLALLFRPLVRRLYRVRIPETVGAGLVVLTLLGVAVGAGSQLVQPAHGWMNQMPELLRETETKLRELRKPILEIGKASKKVEELTNSASASVERPLRVEIQPRPLASLVLSQTGSFLTGTVVVAILLYFLLALGDRFLNNVVRVMPTFRSKRDFVQLIHNVERGVSAYLFTVTAINVCLGLVMTAAMWLLDMPNPPLWGMMATLFNFIPYVGALAGTVIVFLVAAVNFDSLLYALLVPTVYFTITSVEGNLITPAILGRSMQMNPILVFLALVFWGWMWGVGGALLAVPLLAILKLCCDQFESTRWLGTIIG